MYKNVLLPLDGSPFAERALDELPHVLREDGQVVLVQVVRPAMPLVSPEVGVSYQAVDVDVIRKEALGYLNTQAQILAQQGIQARVEIIEEGDVAEGVLQFAAANEIELIIMSTHGRGGLSRLVFGSVAESVLRHAPCPVLIVRPH